MTLAILAALVLAAPVPPAPPPTPAAPRVGSAGEALRDGPAGEALREGEKREWTFRAEEVSVEDVSGAVEVQAGAGEEIRVVAEALPHREGSGTWQVAVWQDGKQVRARVCCGACGARSRSCEGSQPVRFVITVPSRTRVSASTVSADVLVRGVTASVSAQSVSGHVVLEGGEGEQEVNSVSGPVRVAPRTVADTSVHTVSGPVELEVPQGGGARVRFTSLSGKLDGQPIAMGERRITVGPGGPRVHIETVSGDLHLHH